MARKSRRTRRLRVVNPDCAGIDIGKDRHFVAVDPERSDEPVRSFGSFTRDLEAMTAWLASCGVSKVAMESTSVYWIPNLVEALGLSGMIAPVLPVGAMHGTASLAHEHQVLVPALKLDDIGLTDNLSAHHGAAARNTIRRASVV